MENNTLFQKDQFLTNEFLMFSLNAGLQTRNSNYPIYQNQGSYGNVSQILRSDVKDYLVAYLQKFNDLTEKNHYDKIEIMSKIISDKHGHILFNGRLRIGVSQKIINLFLKYMWTIGKIRMPYHCPFDNIIKTRLLAENHNFVLQDWTVLDSIEEYKKYVSLAKIKANNKRLTIAEWELLNWNRR